MSLSHDELISELEARVQSIADEDDELSKQLVGATDLDKRLLAVADKQDEINARLDSLETAADKSDTSESASAGGANLDHEPDAEEIQKQNSENIHILAKELGVRSSRLDGSASSTGFADFLGLK